METKKISDYYIQNATKPMKISAAISVITLMQIVLVLPLYLFFGWLIGWNLFSWPAEMIIGFFCWVVLILGIGVFSIRIENNARK